MVKQIYKKHALTHYEVQGHYLYDDTKYFQNIY